MTFKNGYGLTIILLALHLVKDAYVGSECDEKLLSSFGIKGMHTSMKRSSSICPEVSDSCCSPIDELTIV